MIRVTLRDVLEGQEALQKLSNQQLPGRTAFRIGRLLKKLEDVLTSYNEVRTSLLEKYAKHKEDGSFEVNDKNEYIFEDVNVFIEEMNKLIMEEVEVEADPIDFKSIENVSFTPVEITLLEPFIKFEDEE
jgi:hypothetical protein